VTGLQFAVAIVNALAWSAAVVVACGLLRREPVGAFQRVPGLEFPGGKATFATLPDFEEVAAAGAKDAGFPDDGTVARPEVTEFSLFEALAAGLLEYQLNVASGRVAPDQPHGWPQAAHNLEAFFMSQPSEASGGGG
jgi:hypothetical protein